MNFRLDGNLAFPDESDTQRLFGTRVTGFYARRLTGCIRNLEGHKSVLGSISSSLESLDSCSQSYRRRRLRNPPSNITS